MSNEELVRLIKQGDNSLMADLYEQNRRFIASIARHSTNNPDEIEDTMQDAYFGLYEAVNGYDESMGYKFLTYAKYYIQQAIQRGGSASMHVPERIIITARKIKHMQNKLALELERMPTAAELSKCTGLEVKAIKYILSIVQPAKSIYEPVIDDLLLGDTIADDTANDFENDIAAADERLCIRKNIEAALHKLPECERTAVQYCYLQSIPIPEAVVILGISIKQFNKLLNNALRYLRHPKISLTLIDDEVDRNTLFYRHRGIQAFNNTWISSTEQTVFERESMRRQM